MKLNLSKHKYLHIAFAFLWHCLWVGAYYNLGTKTLHVCPLPTLSLFLRLYDRHYCEACDNEVVMVAIYDGESWATGYECDECWYTGELPWPFGDNLVSGSELEQAGYELR